MSEDNREKDWLWWLAEPHDDGLPCSARTETWELPDDDEVSR